MEGQRVEEAAHLQKQGSKEGEETLVSQYPPRPTTLQQWSRFFLPGSASPWRGPVAGKLWGWGPFKI